MYKLVENQNKYKRVSRVTQGPKRGDANKLIENYYSYPAICYFVLDGAKRPGGKLILKH